MYVCVCMYIYIWMFQEFPINVKSFFIRIGTFSYLFGWFWKLLRNFTVKWLLKHCMRRFKNRFIWNLASPNKERYNITRPSGWSIMAAVMNILWVIQILFLFGGTKAYWTEYWRQVHSLDRDCGVLNTKLVQIQVGKLNYGSYNPPYGCREFYDVSFHKKLCSVFTRI